MLTAALPASGASRFRLVPAILVCAILGGLLWLSQSELNPDWGAYRLIYESEGAWLGSSGRDPAYTGLNSLANAVLGADGYESFRALLATYFFAFSVLLVTGRISRLSTGRGNMAAFVLAAVYFGFSRFTIQIREGVAMSLVVFALAVFRRHAGAASVRPVAHHRSDSNLSAWMLMVLATCMHASIALVMAIMIAAVWVNGADAARPSARESRFQLVTLLAALIVFVTLAQLKLGGVLDEIATETLGDRLVEEHQVTALQLAFWGVYGVVCWMVQREMRRAMEDGAIRGIYGWTLRTLAGPATFGVYLSLVACLLMGISSLVLSSYVRLIHMVLALSILQLAILGRTNWKLTLAILFLLVDQARNIADSISIYFGVDLY